MARQYDTVYRFWEVWVYNNSNHAYVWRTHVAGEYSREEALQIGAMQAPRYFDLAAEGGSSYEIGATVRGMTVLAAPYPEKWDHNVPSFEEHG